MTPRINAKWAGHYGALLALRRRLGDDRAEEMAEATSPLEPHSLSQADSASDAFDHDMLLSELSTVQDRIFEVEDALQRVENGTYGICELSGKPIPQERLRAIPWTRFTAEAETELEQQHALGRPHFGELRSVRKPGFITPASAETPFEEGEAGTNEAPGSKSPVEEEVAVRGQGTSPQNRETS